MTLSFWRYSHLALAVFSSLFLVLASVTGSILAVDAIQEQLPNYKVENFDAITLTKSLPKLRAIYPEINEIQIDHNQFVSIQAIDSLGNDVNAYIDPVNGKVIGSIAKKSDFIQWITALHRSLFLHETGRIFIGINTFFLFLIAISGSVLILKRQKGLRSFFSKIVKENFSQYYHVFLGRIALIPILIIALSGTYLSMERFHLFDNKKESVSEMNTVSAIAVKKFDLKHTHLSAVTKIIFPFSEDKEDYYTFELKDRKIEVDQYSNEIITENIFPRAVSLTNLSLDLHTGRSSIIWAIILGLASINIVFFIYSGFTMTLKRRANSIKNKYKATESKYIVLVGSENGSTLRFGNAILKQLNDQGEKAHLAELNSYTNYPKAAHLIILTSTYGLGDPPSNATKFISLLEKNKQQQQINYSVIGFGSTSYPDFCAYAKAIDSLLAKQSWANRYIELQTVNDKSAHEFVNWVQLWNAQSNILFASTPSLYNHIPNGLEKLVVLDKTMVSEKDQTFLLTLRAGIRSKFTSGDLLAIYPANDNRERLYSIAKNNGNIQLAIKLHPSGLGSSYLNELKPGETIKAQLLNNKTFHFPKKVKKIALISNGTGIAPFLGMISQNKKKSEIHLYSGFRQNTAITTVYQNFASEMKLKNQLSNFHIAYSREENHQYVMDLIKRDSEFFADLLVNNGSIMICGSLKMQFDVESVLNSICLIQNKTPLSEYKTRGQILTDCY